MHKPRIEELLADPPLVHDDFGAGHAQPTGVRLWATHPGCYQFICDRCDPGMRTLETGLGLSTVIFAIIGTIHTCVTPSVYEVERVRAYCADRGISLDNVTFEVGFSEDVLPRLERIELDLVFIDGGHAFPIPSLDWFYTARRLREGGTVILDDLHLPGVAIVGDFIAADPRWTPAAGTWKWAAFDRTVIEDLAEGWETQSFFRYPPPPTRTPAAELARELGRRVRTRARIEASGAWTRAKARMRRAGDPSDSPAGSP